METLLQDVRFALRTLLRSPVTTAVAVLSLAVGIGANTTLFSAVNALLLRPLPVADPASLVAVYTTEKKQEVNPFSRYLPVSRPNFVDLEERTDVFAGMIDLLFVGASLTSGEGEPEQIGGQMVSANYFDLLGVSAYRGRTFLAEESGPPGAHPVAVLSHAFWSRRFGADEAIVGRSIQLNGHPFTVVGVAPPGFHGTFTLANPDFWVPVAMHDTFLSDELRQWFDDRRALMTFAYARLAPGVSRERAEAAVQAVGRSLAEAFPKANENRSFTLVPIAQAASGFSPQQRDRFELAGVVMMSVVGLVLLIACVNVANLLLGRAAARRKEVAIRMSQGASRARLARQLLTESIVLATLAGAAGLLVAYWGRSALWALRPPFLQNSGLELALDPTVLGFTLAISILTGVLFGLAPALRASRPGLVQDLKEPGLSDRGTVSAVSLKNTLVVGQVAVSFVALVAAVLFLRSLGAATRIDLGFEPRGLAEMAFNLGQRGYSPERGERFFDQALDRVRALPAVTAATLAAAPPLSGGALSRTVFVEGRDPEADNNAILTPVNEIGLDYFKTVGARFLQGRDFSAADRGDTVAVAIINTATRDRFWGGQDPLGQRFHFHGQEVVREVVGVVATTKLATVGEEPQPRIYIPRRQAYLPAMTLLFRTQGDPEAVLATVRQAVQELDPELPITNARTMMDDLEAALWAPRTSATLLAFLGALALALAAVGIYGVMAYTVTRRHREIGIRVALGARRAAVAGMVVRQGMALIVVGLALGVAAVVAIGRLAGATLDELLYGVRGTDATTLASTAALLLLVALLANLLPAHRAASVDPVRVLKAER